MVRQLNDYCKPTGMAGAQTDTARQTNTQVQLGVATTKLSCMRTVACDRACTCYAHVQPLCKKAPQTAHTQYLGSLLAMITL
mmetsp:Transcript_33670/g.74560  ORF Transcript_33670/g.74560 Transcript_33670/m.74560 type:complete len:82 (-) Transcript_33670:526-771(-)